MVLEYFHQILHGRTTVVVDTAAAVGDGIDDGAGVDARVDARVGMNKEILRHFAVGHLQKFY